MNDFRCYEAEQTTTHDVNKNESPHRFEGKGTPVSKARGARVKKIAVETFNPQGLGDAEDEEKIFSTLNDDSGVGWNETQTAR